MANRHIFVGFLAVLFSNFSLVACGAIRERISQELARAVFDAVKRDIERRDATL